MKKLINEILFGKNAVVSGLIALAVVSSVALGCNCGKDFDLSNLAKNANTGGFSNSSDDTSDGSVPSNIVVEGLVKDTMREFADAVDTGDFNTIYNNASSDFQGTYTVDEMKTAFKSYTDKKKIVVPILNKVEGLDAEFDSPPSIRSEKSLNILVAKGKFNTKPYKTRFDYEYVMRGGEWKLLKLVINIP
ncbi:MAG: hypothetical protein WBD16_15435 [Pyrinomonadaceae bacterium]